MFTFFEANIKERIFHLNKFNQSIFILPTFTHIFIIETFIIFIHSNLFQVFYFILFITIQTDKCNWHKYKRVIGNISLSLFEINKLLKII